MRSAFLVTAVSLAWVCLPAVSSPTSSAGSPAWDPAFLQHCAFVSVDVQEPGPRAHITEEQVPKLWKRMGFTAADVNAATDYAYDVAFPNSRRVADACRSLGLPMIFIHWGCLFKDGMDLGPEVRQEFLGQFGTNYEKWGNHLGDPLARPAAFLGVRDGDYVIPKADQDAFASSNLKNVLTNLGVKNIVFIGGHTGACLGRTAKSAKRLGFHTLCVEDATFDARQSSRVKWIEETGYDCVCTTEELLRRIAEAQSGGLAKQSQ